MLIPSKMTKTVLPTLTCVLIATSALVAQEKKPPPATEKKQTQEKPAPVKPVKPAELDALARKTLDRWAKLCHHAGRSGVKKIQFDIVVTSRGGMTGKWKAKGTYSFDSTDKKKHEGTLSWDDKDIDYAMTRRGWTAKTFARDFQPNAIFRRLAGTKVTGASRRNGTIVTADGGGKEKTHLLFDKKGVQIGAVVGPMRKKLFYETKDGKYVRSGESYTMPDAEGDLTVWHGDVSGFHVPIKIHEVVKVKGTMLSDLTFLFKNHKINAGIKKPKTEPKKKGDQL